jgi:hypothetical protein
MTLGPSDLPEDPFGDGGMAQVVCTCTTDAFHLILTSTTAIIRCPNCHTDQAIFPRSADMGPFQGWPGQGDQGAGMAQRDMLPGAPAQHTWTPQCDGLHPPGPCPPRAVVEFTPDRPGQWRFDPNTGIATHESGHQVQGRMHAATLTCDGNHPPGPCPATGTTAFNYDPGTGQVTHGPVRAGWGIAPADQPPLSFTRDDLTSEIRAQGGCSCPGDRIDPSCPVHGTPLPPSELPLMPPLPPFSEDIRNVVLRGGPPAYDGQATWVSEGVQSFGIAGVGAWRDTGQAEGKLRVFTWQGKAA